MVKAIEELRQAIINELMYVDIRPYSHNLVGLYMDELERNYGIKEVKRIVNDHASLWESKGWGHLVRVYVN